MILLDTNVLGRITDSADPQCAVARKAIQSRHALVKDFGIRGIRAHDARLVAAMHTYGITQLLTFNQDDFKGFSITTIHPADSN
jgi:predicted nucleic acid-binding protein